MFMGTKLRSRVERLLDECGVHVNGQNACDIRVRDERFFARVLMQGPLGFGESYVDGWWDAYDLVDLICRLLRAQLDERVRGWRDALAYCTAAIFNLQRMSRAFHVGERHYDLGNDLYQHMLDRRMIYSCAYWESANTLEGAQEAKLELVFRKLELQPRDHVLDVGCGWGGALKFAAERYGVTGLGVTVSREQVAYARQQCAGLPIDIRLQDYRELKGSFDHIYSIGMFEHVGKRNYRTYMKVMHNCLRPQGRFLLHCIGSPHSMNHTDPWIEKYIFPNSMIPSQRQITRAIDGLFQIVGWQSIGQHYERTLLAWKQNFENNLHQLPRYQSERFLRMWRYYLGASAAAFRARKLDVWQVLLEPAAHA
jgi:cyclopropane-fatty-acyl-phospholipid synthase